MQEFSTDSKSRIEAVLRKAAEDVSFREQLMSNPDAALASTNLNAGEKDAVKGLRRVSLEEMGVDVRPFRAVLRDNGAKISAVSFAESASGRA